MKIKSNRYLYLFAAAFFGYLFFISSPQHALAYKLIDFGSFNPNQSVAGASQTVVVGNTSPSGGQSFTGTTSVAPNWFTINGSSQLNGTLPAATNATVTIALTSAATDGTNTTGVHTFTVNIAVSAGTQNPSDHFDVKYTLNAPIVVSPPTTPVAANGAPAVACGTVHLTWNAGTNADSYDVFRNGTPLLTHYVGLSYNDTTGTPGTAYTYTIDSYNIAQNITSATSTFSNSPITPIRCVADFSTSDKVITAVNAIAYPYTSTCVAAGTGTKKTISNGDTISFQLNLCNTGAVTAKSVSLKDTLVQNLQNPRNYKINGSSTVPTIAGNTITFNVGDIASAGVALITFDADVPASTGSTQTLQRLKNDGDITYTTNYVLGGDVAGGNGNCTSSFNNAATACHISTGFVVFYNGVKNPGQKEVNP